MYGFTSRARPALAAATGIAIVAGTTLLAALPASAATTDDVTGNGGAARNGSDMTQALRDSIVDGPAKNVILLIGDGMGDSEITIARNYAEGAAGRFAGIDSLPITGQYTTYAVTPGGVPNYASESASTASAWSTGTKAVNGQLSVDYQGTPQTTLLEIAKANGKKTGDVSTASIQDASPAAQFSHISSRSCFGPDETSTTCSSAALENGGLGSISEQLLNLRPDVTLGGGAETFAQSAKAGPWKDKTLSTQAVERGYQVVGNADDLDKVTTADANQPVLGLFTPGNFPTRWNGPAAVEPDSNGALPAPAPCSDNPGNLDDRLSLGALTSKAISLLDNENGFFLQVEAASIDKQNHAANACAQIGETVDFDNAVQAAMEFATKNKDTLVLVSADHAHTSQLVGTPIPGLNTNLITREGQPMIVAYGTGAKAGGQQHTGAQVRVAGYGPGAANVAGLTDQTDLFFTAANSLGLNRDLAALSKGATIAAPTQVRPGSTFTVTVNGLAADWQATATLNSQTLDLGQADVLNGTATYTVTLPETFQEGAHTLTITGSKTGTVVTAPIEVRADAPANPGTPAEPSGAGAASDPRGGGGLPNTGGTAPIAAALLAAAAVAAGVYMALRRRRRLSIN